MARGAAMDQKVPGFVREYVGRLSDDDVRFLLMRLDQRFHGDEPEALSFLQRDQAIDEWLGSAPSAAIFYSLLDTIQGCLEAEYRRRPFK